MVEKIKKLVYIIDFYCKEEYVEGLEPVCDKEKCGLEAEIDNNNTGRANKTAGLCVLCQNSGYCKVV